MATCPCDQACIGPLGLSFLILRDRWLRHRHRICQPFRLKKLRNRLLCTCTHRSNSTTQRRSSLISRVGDDYSPKQSNRRLPSSMAGQSYQRLGRRPYNCLRMKYRSSSNATFAGRKGTMERKGTMARGLAGLLRFSGILGSVIPKLKERTRFTSSRQR